MALQSEGLLLQTDWQSIYLVSLICVLDAVRINTINVNSWAYLISLDQSATEQFFGQINTAQTFCTIMASLLGGWLSNQISHTKPPILFGIFLMSLGSVLYANLDLDEQISRRKWIFMGAQMLIGSGSGLMMTWRVHVAMNSTEKDRQKANSLAGFGLQIGFLMGPMFVLFLGYLLSRQDLSLPWGSKLNLYTAPAYLTAFACLATSILTFFLFNGRIWKEQPKMDEKASQKKHTPNCWLGEEKGTLDWWAIGACFSTRLCITSLIVYMISLSGPYSMLAFGWSGEQAVVYFMLIQGLSGLLGILVNLGYALRLLDRLKERLCILFSLSIFLLFFLLTFPWPFLSSTLPEPRYENGTLANGTVTVKKVTEGCDPNEFVWCNTPAINICLYMVSLILVQGLGMPIIQLNLDVLYSRLLGQIKQGTMQGLFMSLGEIFSVGGPLLFTSIYQSNGPKPIWIGEMAIFAVGIFFWTCCYGRLKPGMDGPNEKKKSYPIVVGQAVAIGQPN